MCGWAWMNLLCEEIIKLQRNLSYESMEIDRIYLLFVCSTTWKTGDTYSKAHAISSQGYVNKCQQFLWMIAMIISSQKILRTLLLQSTFRGWFFGCSIHRELPLDTGCLAQNSSACRLAWLLGGEVQKKMEKGLLNTAIHWALPKHWKTSGCWMLLGFPS